MTVKKTLKNATDNISRSSSTPALDAEVLLGYLLEIDKAKLYQKLDDELDENQLKKFQELIARRQKHEPVAYITKHKEFYGLDFYVDKRVLIPRPETELLVEEVIEYAKGAGKRELEICDVGTGSGCIAIALAKNLPEAKIYAFDVSVKALAVAEINIKKHEVQNNVKLLRGDLLEPLKDKVDIIISNPPYLAQKRTGEIKPEVIDYEPSQALFAGSNGLEYYQKILEQAGDYLNKPGLIALEIDPLVSRVVEQLAQKSFFQGKITIKKDLAEQERVLIINH